MDAAEKNVSKYKAGFTGKNKSPFVKVGELKIVPGSSEEHLASMGMKSVKYPTPINPHKK